jgi:cytoskeletal protein CcmA (bactofilin family)
MEMFGKETADAQGTVSSILGENCKFTGDVEAKGTLRIDGVLDGKIEASDTVIVGKGGTVKGEIHAAHAVVSGTVEGNVFAKRKIELESGSRLIGDVETVSLVIEDGVFFEGSSKMRKEADAYTGKPKIIKQPEEEKIKQP